MRTTLLPLLAAALVFSHAAIANPVDAGDLRIAPPFARPSVAGQKAGAAYLSIDNRGSKADKLIAASTPAAASVELHTMHMDGNIMRMREVPAIELQAGGKLTMKPGDGYHLMLMGLTQPLKNGDKFPLTLTFERAGKVEVSVVVGDPGKTGADKAAVHHQHQQHQHGK